MLILHNMQGVVGMQLWVGLVYTAMANRVHHL